MKAADFAVFIFCLKFFVFHNGVKNKLKNKSLLTNYGLFFKII